MVMMLVLISMELAVTKNTKQEKLQKKKKKNLKLI